MEGLPQFEPDLGDIDSLYIIIIVLDDLMDMAVDSPIISKLFTQRRHRNTRVILYLQNSFPKGKYNTTIIRNTQYKVLFRYQADRHQNGFVEGIIFDRNKPSFMKINNNITSQSYTYVKGDNIADAPLGCKLLQMFLETVCLFIYRV